MVAASPAHDRAGTEPSGPAVARPGVAHALGLALGFTAVSGAVTAWQVRAHYATHLPHFDSIGSYFIAYGVVNAVERGGAAAGLAEATAVSLGWLQPLYALLLTLAGVPARSPEWLVSLNFLLMALTQAAIGVWCRDRAYGWQQAAVLLLLPYLPGAFFAWDGGLQDWRRDIQLNILLIGVLFGSLAYVLRPSWQRGVGVGLLLGLAQWSRDNALATLLVVVVPAAALTMAEAWRSRRWSVPMERAVVPLLVYLAMAVPYYALTLQTTIARYLYSVWGPGEDRLSSLRQFWSAPLHVLLGGTFAYNGQPAAGRLTLLALGVLAGLIVVGLLLRLLRLAPRHLREQRAVVLIGSGLFVMVAVVVYNTLGLGYGAQYHGMPFVPVATGIVAAFAGLSDAMRTGRARSRVAASVSALGLAIIVVGLLALNVSRVRANESGPSESQVVNAVRDASLLIATRASDRPVAVLWIGWFSRYHLAYFQAQAGAVPTQFMAAEIDGPLPSGQRADAFLSDLEARVQRAAALVVLCEDTSRYADESAANALFREGRPLIERLLADPSFAIVGRISVAGAPLVILERRTSS